MTRPSLRHTGPIRIKDVVEPYYRLDVDLMYGDGDYYQTEHFGKYDTVSLKSIWFWKGKKKYHYETEADIEERAKWQPNLTLEKDNLFDAIRTMERAKNADWSNWSDCYEGIEGYDNHLYDRIPVPREVIPRFKNWRVVYVDESGDQYNVEVDNLRM